jgi:hypothetical protein
MNQLELNSMHRGPASFATRQVAFLSFLLAVAVCCSPRTIWAAAAPTTTTLAISSYNNTVTSVIWGDVVTLTATVDAGTTPVGVGLVKFCDAVATHCTDIHIIGTAQLTSAGTATINFVPAIGTHTYKAEFIGTKKDATSTSGPAAVKVLGPYPTLTSIEQIGSNGVYALESTVTGTGPSVPTGTVVYLDTTNGYNLLGEAELVDGTTLPMTFGFSGDLAGGNFGNSIATADFDGDGFLDVAVAYAGSVVVSLGDGNGGFTNRSFTTTPSASTIAPVLATGDFNGDGVPDLVLTQPGTSNLVVLLGRGNGSFNVEVASPVAGSNPVAIAVADLNGDGIADLAVVNEAGNNISVLLGKGDGTFTPVAASHTTGTGSGPVAIATGDFNGDGVVDLAVANSLTNNVLVLLGVGDGTFGAAAGSPTSTGAGSAPSSLVAGDFNGDGKADLAVSTTGISTITVLLGNGKGAFTAAASPATLHAASAPIAMGDFNGDGIPDLALGVGISTTQPGGTVFLGKGDGTFLPSAEFEGGAPIFLTIGDFNGDGKSDVVEVDPPLGYYGGDVAVSIEEQNRTALTLPVGIAPIIGIGEHAVAALYSGDSANNSSFSNDVFIPGIVLPSAVSLKASASTIAAGAAITLSVTVSGDSVKPTGSVSFYVGTTLLGAATLNASGAAALATTALPAGADKLTCVYSGDKNYYPGVSSLIVVTVTPKAVASVKLKSSASSVEAGKPVTFTAAAAGGRAMPTGMVSFYAGKVLLATEKLNASGTATCATGKLAAGENEITARYDGDKNYAAVASKPVVVSVVAP